MRTKTCLKCLKTLIFFLKPEGIQVCFSISLGVVGGGRTGGESQWGINSQEFGFTVQCLMEEEEWEFPSPSPASSGCVLENEDFLGFLSWSAMPLWKWEV